MAGLLSGPRQTATKVKILCGRLKSIGRLQARGLFFRLQKEGNPTGWETSDARHGIKNILCKVAISN